MYHHMVFYSFLHLDVLYLVGVTTYEAHTLYTRHQNFFQRLYNTQENITVTKLLGKDLCPAACSSDLRNSVTRLKSVSKLAGYWRGARRCDVGSENGPRNTCDDRLASSGGILPAMFKLKTSQILLVKKVKNAWSVK